MGRQVDLRKHYYEANGDDRIPAELFKILKDDAVEVLHSVRQQIWKTQQWPHIGLEKISFHSNPKKGQCQKILKELRGPDLLTFLPRNVYAGQEATVRTRCETNDRFQIKKGVGQDCITSPCLFINKLNAEYIMRNARLDESEVGIKIAGENINHLRYADDTTLMAESEEELKGLLMTVKEESEKAGLKFNIQKTKIVASSPITPWQTQGENMEAVTDFIFLGSKNHCCHEIKMVALWRESYDKPRQNIKR